MMSFVGAVLCCYGAGCCSAPDNLGASTELNGLSAAIESIDRTGNELEIVYGLEWSPMPTWELRGIEPLIPTFRDRDGKEIAGLPTLVLVSLDEKFLDLEVRHTTTTLKLQFPDTACTLSLALGRSGLETPRVRVP